MSTLTSRLRERVRIEQPAATDDGYGGADITWQTVATVYAEVTALTGGGRERVVGEQVQASAGYRVVMRVRGDLNASMRLIWKSHTLLIHSIHEQQDSLTLLTYEDGI